VRRICVVTVARSDWGLYLPVLRRITADPELALQVVAAGTHLDARYGATIDEIEEDGFAVDARIETVDDEDTPEAITRSIARAVAGYGAAYARLAPDVVLLLGDRYEMHAAAVAAVPFRLPVAHIQGGESTEGAIDEHFRHSITKLAHLHFPATELYGRRLVQMGEDPAHVVVSGAPAIDNVLERPELSLEQLRARIGLDLTRPTLLVTYHPVTQEFDDTAVQVDALLEALGSSGHQLLVTFPNVDTSGQAVLERLERFAADRADVAVVENLGSVAYLSALRHVRAMVGNSSSGIIESASFELPVVNIGTRQLGRLRPANVIDVGYGVEEIRSGLERALSDEFRAGLQGMENPYGDGRAADRIVAALREVELGRALVRKSFRDLDCGSGSLPTGRYSLSS
jgi:UDP-hydrolysing UDP-N-acetyl-D-glucosamine 2-epimerase